MEILNLLKLHIKEPTKLLFILLIISGIMGALLIVIINAGAASISNQQINHQFFLLFIFGVVVYVLSKKYVTDKSIVLIEGVVEKVQLSIVNKVRHTELSTFEAMGTASIYARLNQDASVLSRLSGIVVHTIQSAIMIFFALIYIATVSMLSFFIIAFSLGICAALYHVKQQNFNNKWLELARKEATFHEKLSHVLQGFKEIKLNRKKNEGVLLNFAETNTAIQKHRVNLGESYNILQIFSETFFYIIMGIVIFIIPSFIVEKTQDVIEITAILLFIMGPFEGILSSVQFLSNVNASAKNIFDLEAELEEELRKNDLSIKEQNQPAAYEELSLANNIVFRNLSFAYPKTAEFDYSFEVGPINLSIAKGELIFITGGNGSGKSTLLKLLTGLYPPQTGQILIDTDHYGGTATEITPENYQQYRNLFTAIFTDFHLFDKIYDSKITNPTTINQVLLSMELPANKVQYADGKFTNLNLSTGQKKRLALTTSIIEDKPIYIFDEVAADLDPEFRDKYYFELLPELKERNKIVIVVSHDRYYWTVPDRLIQMTDGKMKELSKEEINKLVKI